MFRGRSYFMNSNLANTKLKEMLDLLDKNRYKGAEETIDFGRMVYEECKKEDYEPGMAFSLLAIGQSCVDSSHYEDALNYLFDSIKLAQNRDICDLQILAYISIGNMYFDLGNYEKSLEYYQAGERLIRVMNHSKNYFKNIGPGFYTTKIKNNLGEIHRLIGSYKEAKEYYLTAIELEKDSDFTATFGTSLSNLGNVEYHLGNYQQAIIYFEEAIQWLLHYNYQLGLIETYGMLALVYEKLENYLECTKYFELAIDISSNIEYTYSKVDILIDYSLFLDRQGFGAKALDTLAEAYTLTSQKKMYAKSMEICKKIVAILEKSGDLVKSNYYYRLYFENEACLAPIKQENKARNLKMKMDLEHLEDEHKSILEQSEVFRRRTEDLIEIIKNISIINELGEKLSTTLELDKIYEMLFDTVRGILPFTAFAVGLYNKEEHAIQYHFAVENNERIPMYQTSLDNESSLAVKCLNNNQTLVINDIGTEYLYYIEDVNYIVSKKGNEDLNSAIFCPLIIDQVIIGVMTVQASEKNTFSTLVVEMIKALSTYAAIAIHNSIKSKSLVNEISQRVRFQEELEETNRKLIYLSENDGLTNIPNRRKLDFVINETWDQCIKDGKVLSLIIFDIDHFKQFNDNFGHTKGDQCLIDVCNYLKEKIDHKYFAARYGGDEFVVLLPETSLEYAKQFAEEFRIGIEEMAFPNPYSKVSDVVTVTLGVSSVLPSKEFEIIDLIRQADMNLYAAKENGKNRVVGSVL